MTDKELLAEYWASGARAVGISANEFVRSVRRDEARRRLLLKHSNTTPLERCDWAGIVRLMAAYDAQVAETTPDGN